MSSQSKYSHGIKPRHYKMVPGLISHTEVDEWSIQGVNHFTEAPIVLNVGTQSSKLVSSAEGSIEMILFTIPGRILSQPNPIMSIYTDLMSKLPKETEFIIVVHKSTEEEVLNWLEQNGRTEKVSIVPVPNDINFTIWAEDAQAIVRDSISQKNYVLEPFDFERNADSLITEYVANAINYDSFQTPLHFLGGNILIGDDFFLVGEDYLNLSLKFVGRVILPEGDENPKETVYRAFQLYLDSTRKLFSVKSKVPIPTRQSRTFTINDEQWTEIIYFNNNSGTVQPIFHIDMFITLIGRSDNGNYKIFVGSPKIAAELLEIPIWDHSLSEAFDSIADNLSQEGFQVHRNPLPLAYFDDKITRTRIWYHCTYNNALVENSNERGKTVWLPTYGYGNWGDLLKTDKYMKELWESFGFTVEQIKDCHPLASQFGALHCIKKYLARGN